jgi:homocitrate synthase NifV
MFKFIFIMQIRRGFWHGNCTIIIYFMVKYGNPIIWENLMNKKPQICIIDTTLRDGEQAPGVVFNLSQKIEIIKKLAEIGIDELEVANPCMGEQEIHDLACIQKENLPCTLTCWSRARMEDIELTAKYGTGNIHISFPVSPILLQCIGKNQKWVLRQVKKLVPFAKKYFKFVSVGALDATRTPGNFLKEFALLSASQGAQRIRIADTVGIGTPSGIRNIIKPLAEGLDIPIEFHGHNDLGMATANSITALEAGARAVSVTVNGLGERAGNTALEELVMALKFTELSHKQLDTTRLCRLCNYVAMVSGRTIPPWKSITGAAMFRHESGIHCHALLKNPLSYQPFLPEEIGKDKNEFIIGKHSGSGIIQYILEKKGITISRAEAKVFISQIRNAINNGKGFLDAEELEYLYWKTSYEKNTFM